MPRITGYSKEEPLYEGQLKQFHCDSSGGNPPPTLRWYIKSAAAENTLALPERGWHELPSTSSNIPNTSGSSGAAAELQLLLQPSSNNALLRCEASSLALRSPLQSELRLNVQFASDQLRLRNHSTAVSRPGSRFELSCETGSCNPPCNVAWLRNGRSLNIAEHSSMKSVDHKTLLSSDPSSSHIISEQRLPGEHGGSLTITRLVVIGISSQEHQTLYECVSSAPLMFNQTARQQLRIQVARK